MLDANESSCSLKAATLISVPVNENFTCGNCPVATVAIITLSAGDSGERG